MAEESYYELLQVQPTADQEIIQAAYRRLILRYHPDQSNEPNAAEMTQRLNLAYEILSDPTRRADYDRGLGAQASRPAPPRKSRNQPTPEAQPRALHGTGFLGWWEDWGVAASIMLAVLAVILLVVLFAGLATS